MNDEDMKRYNEWIESGSPFEPPWIERTVIMKEGSYYVKKKVIMTPQDVFGRVDEDDL